MTGASDGAAAWRKPSTVHAMILFLKSRSWAWARGDER